MAVRVEINNWKKLSNGETVKQVELSSETGFKVRLLSLGATLQSVLYPGEEEESERDVVLGFDDVPGYDGTDNPFFWGTTGRFTNRSFIQYGKYINENFKDQKRNFFN